MWHLWVGDPQIASGAAPRLPLRRNALVAESMLTPQQTVVLAMKTSKVLSSVPRLRSAVTRQLRGHPRSLDSLGMLLSSHHVDRIHGGTGIELTHPKGFVRDVWFIQRPEVAVVDVA